MTIIANSNEEYHASEGVSKSGLWTIHTKTPFHYRFVTRKKSNAFDLGSAAHCAILEPELFEEKFYRGPDDRRGNKWKDAEAFCEHHSFELLTSGDYDKALALRESAALCSQLQLILADPDGVTETSAYARDAETGVTVRCRPDRYSPRHKLIMDLKTAADASPKAFGKAVENFGYHVQDPLYSEVWSAAGGGDVDGFFFVVVEKSDPPMIACYELDASSVREGHAIYRKALRQYAQCEKSGEWPGYTEDVQRIGISRFAYKLTPPPESDEIEETAEADDEQEAAE